MTRERTDSRTTPYNDQYPTCERTVANLLIYSGAVDPYDISFRLGLEPTEVVRKGQAVANSLGRVRIGRLNGWFLSSEGRVSSRDLRPHLDWLLGLLAPRAQELREIQAISGVTMRVNCIWWSAQGTGGPTLWPEQMKAMSDLNLECSFDVSFFGPDEEESQAEGG